MVKIPKKISDRISKSIPKFQKVLQIAKDRDVNESDTVSILKDIFAEVFGYDKYLNLTSEFAIRGTYCDLAIQLDGKVQFLVEAKAIGITLKDAHMRQALDYGANHGIQWVVLTNGIEWKIYRIRFEKPINYDLVYSFDFTNINSKNDKDMEILFLIAKEGLTKNAREEFFEKVQSVNKFVIGQLIMSEPVLALVRKELQKFSDGFKINLDEVEEMIRTEVLKRELIHSEEADIAKSKVNKFYKKIESNKKKAKKQKTSTDTPTPEPDTEELSITEQLLKEA